MLTQLALDRAGPRDNDGIVSTADSIEKDVKALVVAQHPYEQEEALTGQRGPFFERRRVVVRIGRTVETNRNNFNFLPIVRQGVAGLQIVRRSSDYSIYASQETTH